MAWSRLNCLKSNPDWGSQYPHRYMLTEDADRQSCIPPFTVLMTEAHGGASIDHDVVVC